MFTAVWFQAYLEQIANYIRQNTGIDNKVMDYDPNFCDPFTGSGRYVPSSDSGWYNIFLVELGALEFFEIQYCDFFNTTGNEKRPCTSSSDYVVVFRNRERPNKKNATKKRTTCYDTVTCSSVIYFCSSPRQTLCDCCPFISTFLSAHFVRGFVSPLGKYFVNYN